MSDLVWVDKHQKLSSGELYGNISWSLGIIGVSLHCSAGTNFPVDFQWHCSRFPTHESTKFSGAATDNTSTNKIARKLPKQCFMFHLFQGCFLHGLNLLVEYIFNTRNMNKGGSNETTYLLGNPFEYLLTFIFGCKETVKFFHNHHVAKSHLHQAQETEKLRVLVRPAPTWWGKNKGMWASLLDSEAPIYSIVSGCDLVQGSLVAQRLERQQVEEFVTDSRFIPMLKKALGIIVKYHSD